MFLNTKFKNFCAGAGYPEVATLRLPSAGPAARKPPAVDERKEVENAGAAARAWQVLLLHAKDRAPGKPPQVRV